MGFGSRFWDGFTAFASVNGVWRESLHRLGDNAFDDLKVDTHSNTYHSV